MEFFQSSQNVQENSMQNCGDTYTLLERTFAKSVTIDIDEMWENWLKRNITIPYVMTELEANNVLGNGENGATPRDFLCSHHQCCWNAETTLSRGSQYRFCIEFIYIYIVAVAPINNPLNQPVDQSQQKLHNHFGSIDRLSLVTLFIFIC